MAFLYLAALKKAVLILLVGIALEGFSLVVEEYCTVPVTLCNRVGRLG
jgi:hypothetical protein